MEVTFWGVRGSIAASGPQVAGVGGNTSCVEVVHGGWRLILDAGTGIRALGDKLIAQKQAVRAAILFSHLHWDHLQGFPFFSPAYVSSNDLVLVEPMLGEGERLMKTLGQMMRPPGFPVTLEAMRAKLSVHPAIAGKTFEFGPFRILPFTLPHPQGSMGYRIEADGQSFVYMTDVELHGLALDATTLAAISGADALCCDAQYTPDEYCGHAGPSKVGWGHSTMMDAAELARAASAKRLFLFHHDPAHSDEVVERMCESARRVFVAVEPAREGKCFSLATSSV